MNITHEDGDQYDIHFLTLRSLRPDAIPIVLLHGWPGSPLEFLELLELAKAKTSAEDAPYTFIVPSLPGYGFSSGPTMPHLATLESVAGLIDKLMVGIGYGSGYIAQGGDIGSFVARILASKHEACRAAHGMLIPIKHLCDPGFALTLAARSQLLYHGTTAG